MNQGLHPFQFGASIIQGDPEVRVSDDPEFIDTFGTIHWDVIVWLAMEMSGTTWPRDPISYSFYFHAQVGGQFFPDLKTRVGRASFSPKYKDISCGVNLGCETFRNRNEAEFREALISLMTEALERMLLLAKKKLIPVDLDDVRNKWSEVTARYIAMPLPIQPPVRDTQARAPIPTTGVDYHFAFDTSGQRRAFLTKVKSLKLSVAMDKSEGRYWCTLTDEAAVAVAEELESKLMQACGELEGEYDGWAAPPSFKPAII